MFNRDESDAHQELLSADINLFAYHLPLDWHPAVGNNATLGELMGVDGSGPLNPADTNTPVFKGYFSPEITVQTLAARLSDGLGREPLVIGEGNVNSIAWCTGAGQGYLNAAADAGADVFVTGEVSEQTVHTARERGIAFIAAGHHATERYGVQALGAKASGAWVLPTNLLRSITRSESTQAAEVFDLSSPKVSESCPCSSGFFGA